MYLKARKGNNQKSLSFLTLEVSPFSARQHSLQAVKHVQRNQRADKGKGRDAGLGLQSEPSWGLVNLGIDSRMNIPQSGSESPLHMDKKVTWHEKHINNTLQGWRQHPRGGCNIRSQLGKALELGKASLGFLYIVHYNLTG